MGEVGRQRPNGAGRDRSVEIVLVEPGAGLSQGHSAEKLGLWCAGWSALGLKPMVCCWDAPSRGIPGAHAVRKVSGPVKLLFHFLPARRQATWADFFTYRLAYRLANRAKLPVLGLTASSPRPVALAAKLAGPAASTRAQIVMYGGLEVGPEGVTMKRPVSKAFRHLQQRGCRLFCNAPLTAQALRRALALETAGSVYYLPDPIYVPAPASIPAKPKWDPPLTLLVPGGDDCRRTPLKHLHQTPPDLAVSKLVVHHPGATDFQLADGTRWSKPPSIKEVRLISDYRTGEGLAEVFAEAKASVIAYRKDFLQGSANLPLSICCGTPVISSRFPYAEDLFSRFGRLGELFEYDNIDDFVAALRRLAAWEAPAWQEFEEARRRLSAQVSHPAVTRQAMALMGLAGPE